MDPLPPASLERVLERHAKAEQVRAAVGVRVGVLEPAVVQLVEHPQGQGLVPRAAVEGEHREPRVQLRRTAQRAVELLGHRTARRRQPHRAASVVRGALGVPVRLLMRRHCHRNPRGPARAGSLQGASRPPGVPHARPVPQPSGAQVADFDGLVIAYDAAVLEPRPWTALQSRWAEELLGEAPPGPVLELCAGAGHIGLRAVRDLDRRLVCVDLDPTACGFARANADRNGLGDRVEVRQRPIREAADAGERFALVIADPPWVPRARVGDHPHDPVSAIDGGDDGLDVARECLAAAGACLAAGASLLLQLGDAGQADRLAPGIARAGLERRELRHGERGVVLGCA